MGNTNTTPWMNLPNPVPSVDPGPDWAANLESCINGIDQHNHSPGSGQQVTPNGMNINAVLAFNNNQATNLQASVYHAQVSLATLLAVYVIGNDLYYNDGAGNVVRITSGGTVNATSSGISSGTASAAFSTGTLVVKSSSTSGANIIMQSPILTNSGNLTNQLTLSAPTLASSFTETLPTVPAATSFMTMDSSGNMATTIATAGGITGSNIASATVARSNLTAPGQQISSANNVSTSSGSLVDVSGSSVSITTHGNPVIIIINGVFQATRADVGQTGYAVAISRGGSTYKNFGSNSWYDAVGGASFEGANSYCFMDTPTTGTYTYGVQAGSLSSSVSLLGSGIQITAYEIK